MNKITINKIIVRYFLPISGFVLQKTNYKNNTNVFECLLSAWRHETFHVNDTAWWGLTYCFSDEEGGFWRVKNFPHIRVQVMVKLGFKSSSVTQLRAPNYSIVL